MLGDCLLSKENLIPTAAAATASGVPRSANKSNYRNIFKTLSRPRQDSSFTYYYCSDRLAKAGRRKGAGDADTAWGAVKGQALTPFLAVIWYPRAACAFEARCSYF